MALETSTATVESDLHRVGFQCDQRPWAPGLPGLLRIGALAGLVGVSGGSGLLAVGCGAALWLVALAVGGRLHAEVGPAHLEVRGWREGWIPRPFRQTIPLDGVDLFWTPVTLGLGAPVRAWRVEVWTEAGSVFLPHVRCTWDELNGLRQAVRTGVGAAAGRSGSEEQVPPELAAIRGEAERT